MKHSETLSESLQNDVKGMIHISLKFKDYLEEFDCYFHDHELWFVFAGQIEIVNLLSDEAKNDFQKQYDKS